MNLDVSNPDVDAQSDAAYDAGYMDGHADGVDDGRSEGYDEGVEDGIMQVLRTIGHAFDAGEVHTALGVIEYLKKRGFVL